MVPSRVKHLGKLLLRPGYRNRHSALQKLRNTPRYTHSSTKLLGDPIEFVDAASFLFMYKEIFEQEIYRFNAQTQTPLIIDCGANIGLSVLYFKRLYPGSHVLAFEPDVEAFNLLKRNVHTHGLSDIELFNKAVWSSEAVLEFMAEGADAGRVVNHQSGMKKYEVMGVCLRDYLKRRIDFLKLDVEGSETEIIVSCQDLLSNVVNLFVEYHSFVNGPQTLHIIMKILSETGFRCHIHPPFISPQPFYQRNVHLGMDMQLNIFAFRS